ncbi:hypothetical protein ZWY2020_020907 [Hordeum vulgare]|nr:hypothetical protein ZWY2020_020907 [Hordeum vulgare]
MEHELVQASSFPAPRLGPADALVALAIVSAVGRAEGISEMIGLGSGVDYPTLAPGDSVLVGASPIVVGPGGDSGGGQTHACPTARSLEEINLFRIHGDVVSVEGTVTCMEGGLTPRSEAVFEKEEGVGASSAHALAFPGEALPASQAAVGGADAVSSSAMEAAALVKLRLFCSNIVKRLAPPLLWEVQASSLCADAEPFTPKRATRSTKRARAASSGPSKPKPAENVLLKALGWGRRTWFRMMMRCKNSGSCSIRHSETNTSG